MEQYFARNDHSSELNNLRTPGNKKVPEKERSPSFSNGKKNISSKHYLYSGLGNSGNKRNSTPFYIKKSEKKLTVPSEPKLSTNERAVRRESVGNPKSFCGESESSIPRAIADSKDTFYISLLTQNYRKVICINNKPLTT